MNSTKLIIPTRQDCREAFHATDDAETAFKEYLKHFDPLRQQHSISKVCLTALVNEYNRLLTDWEKKKKIFAALKNFYCIHFKHYSLN